MKITKRIFATLLTFALALSLALPTMAAVNWDDFRITKQPQGLTIKEGESFTLSVGVNVPDGAEVVYQWECDGSIIEGATAPELTIGPGDRYYPEFNRIGGVTVSFKCSITQVPRIYFSKKS